MRPTLLASVLFGLVGLLAASSALAEEKPTLGLRYPSLTPDNASVVFGYRGDVWIAPTDGKAPARRLTIHEAQDTLPRVSPDGRQIAFSSNRNGDYDLFVMSIDGGQPRQVTFYGGGEILCGWSRDGKRLLFLSQRQPSRYRYDLYEIPVAGGTPRRVTFDGAREGSYGPDDKIAYVRGFNSIYWDRYQGSANYDLHVLDAPGALPRRVRPTPGNERYPFFAPDGETLWYVAERDGVANFFATAASGEGEPRQLTRFTEDVWRPDLSWDGRTMVFERLGQLYTVDLSAETPEAKLLPLTVQSDVRHSGVEVRTVTTGAEQVDVSPDGTRLAFSVHGDVWTMPASGGNAERLISGPASEQMPRWRPDGKAIAYQSDQGGDFNLYLYDMATKASRRLTSHKANDFFLNWSPDGRKLAFCSERSGNRDIWEIDVETGEERQLTRHQAADDDPAYSPDGKWIAFDSGRDGPQAIFVMPAEGGDARRVSSGEGHFQSPSWSPDGSMLVFEAYSPAGGESGGLYVVSAQGGPQMQISRDGSGARWSPRGDLIYFHATRGRGASEIHRFPAPRTVEAGERVPFLARVEVDLRSELANLFDEAWQRLRDGFYDPKMHGVDWEKMKKRYRDMAIDAENKDEFHNIVRQMLAELGASHLGIQGGARPANVATPNATRTGHLGVEFDAEIVGQGGRRIASVFSGGPADQAGLRVGDVVVDVGGRRLAADSDLDRLLADTVDKDTAIRFQPITAAGLGPERRITLKPVSLEALTRLEQTQWLQRNERLVAERSDRKLAYLHLSAMNAANLQRFQQAVARWNQAGRVEGLVLDVRYNGGGNIHEQLMSVLRARPYAMIQPRGAANKTPEPSLYWDKPVVVLVNEHSFSDAEVFPHAFQSAGLGKVVGMPTPGGVIGTTDVTLSDGSTFRIPRTGFWALDGKNLEGNGVQPDVLVEETAEDRREGRDPQLERAVDVLMEEVRARREAGQRPASGPRPEPPAPTPTPATPTPATPTPATPTPEPTPSPAPQRPVAAGVLDPLADVGVGEWVRYRISFGGSETSLTLKVAEVRADLVRFEKDVESGGAFLPPLPDELPLGRNVLDLLSQIATVASHSVAAGPVGDLEAEILDVQVDWQGAPIRLQFTNAVPATGLLRVLFQDQVVLEAVEWGGGASEATASPAEAAPHAPAPVAPVPVAPAPVAPPSGPPRAPAATTPPGEGEGEGRSPPLANPMQSAQVGEWVRFRQVLPDGGEVLVTQEVIEVTADEVVLSNRIERGGTVEQGPPVRAPRTGDLGSGGRGGRSAEGRWSRRSATVGDRTMECWVVTTETRRGGSLERWYAAEVPVTGLVRLLRNGQVVRDLVDFGRGGAP